MGVHLVSEHCFEGVVELVLIEFGSSLGKEGVQPVGVGGAVSESVVVDDPQSVSECLGVHGWVQCILGGIEDAESWPVGTSVLLLRQVLVELGGCKLLVALGLLVLSSLELGL